MYVVAAAELCSFLSDASCLTSVPLKHLRAYAIHHFTWVIQERGQQGRPR